MKIVWIAVACVTLWAALAHAADVSAPPQWSAAQVRAARPTTPEPALVLTLERTVTVGDAAPRVTEETVTLAKTFTQVSFGDSEVLFDHALCRVFSWRADESSFASDSCYAPVAYRVFELANRRLIAAAMARLDSSAGPASAAPYWAEAELAVQAEAASPLTRTATGEAVTYRLGDQVVVELRGDAGAVSADEMRAFVRDLANRSPLHPQVRRDLAAARRLPGSIDIVGMSGGQALHERLVIRTAGRRQVPFPLPAALRPALRLADDAAGAPRRRALHAILLAADDPAQPGKPTLQALVAQLAQAAADGNRPMDVMLDFDEVTQLYGPTLSTSDGLAMLRPLAPALQSALRDPDVARFWAANQLAGDPNVAGDRQAAARFLAGANLDDHPFGTFRYITFANLVRGAGDVSQWRPDLLASMPALDDGIWMHIARYPWSSNAYKDLGDVYLSRYRMSDAWLAYDLGRSVDAQWRQQPMAAVGRLEDQLRAQQPDFF